MFTATSNRNSTHRLSSSVQINFIVNLHIKRHIPSGLTFLVIVTLLYLEAIPGRNKVFNDQSKSFTYFVTQPLPHLTQTANLVKILHNHCSIDNSLITYSSRFVANTYITVKSRVKKIGKRVNPVP